MRSLNPENPAFVLACCIFRREDYISQIKPKITRFKIDFWGHDLAILHNQHTSATHLIFESRGKIEDNALLKAFPDYEGVGLATFPPKMKSPGKVPGQITDRELPIH